MKGAEVATASVLILTPPRMTVTSTSEKISRFAVQHPFGTVVSSEDQSR